MPGKRYDKAPSNLVDRVNQVLRDYHERLLEPLSPVTVTVETLLVYGPRNSDGVQTGPAIKVRGREAYACIRVTKLEERVAGRADAVMHVDGDQWKHFSPEQLLALIDHELTHLEPAADQTGQIQLDDVGRVKLRSRPHDFEVGWFDEVAERHGDASIEVLQASGLTIPGRQMYFPGFDLVPRKRKRRA